MLQKENNSVSGKAGFYEEFEVGTYNKLQTDKQFLTQIVQYVSLGIIKYLWRVFSKQKMQVNRLLFSQALSASKKLFQKARVDESLPQGCKRLFELEVALQMCFQLHSNFFFLPSCCLLLSNSQSLLLWNLI